MIDSMQLNNHAPRACLLSVGILTAALVAGCGADSDSGDGASTGAAADGQTDTTAGTSGSTDNPDTGSGTGSAPAGSGPIDGTWDHCGSLRNTFVFAGNRFEQYIAYFTNPDCSGAPLADEDLQPADEPIATGRLELLDTVTTDSGLTARQINLTSETLFGTPVSGPNSVTQYNIVYRVSNEELVLGRLARTNESERPTALDFDTPYRRR